MKVDFSKISSLGTSKADWSAASRLGFTGLARQIWTRMASSRNRMYRIRRNTRLGRAAAARQKAARSFTVGSRRKRTTSGIGVTIQHDARLVYRKRRMPYGRRKRWRSFANRVHAISEKELGSQQVVFNKSETWTNTDANKQLCANYALYSLKSPLGVTPFNDLFHLSSLFSPAVDSVATGLSVESSTKMLLQKVLIVKLLLNK